MNQLLATFITGLVIDENKEFYYVQKDGLTFALAKEEGQHQLGEPVKGFAYMDMKQRLRMTTKEVTATRTRFGWGEVTEVRRDLGVFVDTGLPDKQVVVSLDVLPDLKELWPKKVTSSMFAMMWIKKTGFGHCLPCRKTFSVWLDLPMITCKIKTCVPLSIVSN